MTQEEDKMGVARGLWVKSFRDPSALLPILSKLTLSSAF